MFEKFSKNMMFMLLAVAFLSGSELPAAAKSPRGWGGARQTFLKGVLLNPKQPKSIRGELQNQLNRWHRAGKTGFPRFKNPKGYDIGHHPTKRGSIDVKDLRLETSYDNRSRPQRVMAKARKKGVVAKYF